MQRSWIIAGLILFAVLAGIVFPFVIGVPWDLVFSSDAIGYSTGAKNLLLHGFYTFDGVHPFVDREPVMSFFLMPVYAIFGIENAVALAVVQGILLLIATWFFCDRFARVAGARAAGLAFLIILLSGSVLHTVFSAYRECLVQALLLVFAGLWITEKRSVPVTLLMGVLLGLVILAYYSFVFLPVFLFAAWMIQRRSWKEFGLMMIVCVFVVTLWGLRNASYDGKFRIIDNRRTAVMWFVRGEQAERIHGFEAFRCLYSEYVSRNWNGRSSACSYNGLMHERWPEGFDLQADYSDIAASGKAKILSHLPSFLWFSVFEVLELHLPYVGGGWDHSYNVYAACTQLLLALGFLIGLLRIRDRRIALLTALFCYNTGVFILTDATPRYLLPVFFCYAAIAGIGYDLLLKRLTRSS